jgi:hypothetical protein
MGALLEFLGAEQRIGEVGEKPDRHEAREPIIEDHGTSSSEPVAEEHVANRQREEGDADRKEDDIQHEECSSVH